MTIIEKLSNVNVPIITFDKRLEQFNNEVLFPEKLKMANEIIAKTGLAYLINPK
jgi:hypothetical protein